MSLTVDGFLKHLSGSGVLSPKDLSTIESQIPPEKRQREAKLLADELVRVRKLTPYQASVLCDENPPPLILGNYVLQDKIGAGGMGVVYKAQHRRMKRIVAVKVLSHASANSPSVVKRFLREAEAAAKLTHPNIVTAFDADEFNGVPFLAMEYVDGVDLQIHLQNHGLMSFEKAIDCVHQAAQGLAHAHSQGVIHRDIKPANILLDVKGTVKILDMGLARIQEGFNPLSNMDSADTMEMSGITQAGTVCGTVDFMSPEQATDSSQADHLSDMYSLGATLYFLLTGKPMYEHSCLMDRILAHRQSPLPSLCAANSEIPRQVEILFHRMVAKKKESRYPSMLDAIKHLKNWKNIKDSGKSAIVRKAPTATGNAKNSKTKRPDNQ